MPDSLMDKMEKLADGHARGAELREKARLLREAVQGFYATPQTISVEQFLGRWARARRLYCDLTGEDLVPGARRITRALLQPKRKH